MIATFGVLVMALASSFAAQASSSGLTEDPARFVCPPCGCAEDGKAKPEAGECPACRMQLVSMDKVANVAIVVFPGVELLDFAGPGEVFAAASTATQAFQVFTVGPSREPLTSQGFLQVVPQYSLEDCPEVEILVIPGGAVGALLRNPDAMEALEMRVESAKTVLSVCNGALVLADLGVLDGLEATTHHGSLASLRDMAPDCTVLDDRRFVDNGKIVTGAGVSAGIDAALHVVARSTGFANARRVARYMEYDWKKELSVELEEPSSAEEAGEEKEQTEELPIAIVGLDPILLIEGKQTPGKPALTRDDGWYRYRFASEETRNRFASDPKRYGIQARGSCAGMGAQIEVRSGKPDLFTVHDGRIYIFAGEGCRNEFLAKPDAFVAEINQAVAAKWESKLYPPTP